MNPYKVEVLSTNDWQSILKSYPNHSFFQNWNGMNCLKEISLNDSSVYLFDVIQMIKNSFFLV